MRKECLSIYEKQDLTRYLEQRNGRFKQVKTGYRDREGRRAKAEYVFLGQEEVETCRHCGGSLKSKALRIVTQNGQTHIVNGLAKPVENEDGEIIIIWVCSRQCEACKKHQRVLPACAGRWMRYALTLVAKVLLHLFENDELTVCGSLKPRYNRPWDTLPFYGELSTVYRWRQKAKILFTSYC